MKVQVPVSMHSEDGAGDPAGNQISFLLVRLPVDESDPVARVRASPPQPGYRTAMTPAQSTRSANHSDAHLAGFSIVRSTWSSVPREYSLSISNVPGPHGPIKVLDRHVEALYPFAEVAPHHGLRIAAVSLEGWLFIGLLADGHLVPDLDGIATGIWEEIDELRVRLRLRELSSSPIEGNAGEATGV